MLLPPSRVTLANSHFYGQHALCSDDTRVQAFYRVEINSRMCFSARYGRVHAHNTYTIAYHSQDGTRRFGLVEYYFVLPELGGTALVAIKQLEILFPARLTLV